ncbi:MAG TPA: universal stress protein [Saprospiraceae bacterium]|nr:universal stress protein [Saprospiraceae bacterium]
MKDDIKNILVPIDFSSDSVNALYLADRIARLHDGTVFLVTVVPATSPEKITDQDAATPSRLQDEAGAQLRSFVKSLLTRDVFDHQLLVTHGPIVSSIARTAQENAIDLIVMGSRGKGKILSSWIGSTAIQLLDQKTCPILLVPEKARDVRIQKALCATGLQESDPYRIWKAANLLKKFAPAISCVHVQGAHNGTFHISLQELQAFLKVTIPTIPLKFFEIVGITAWDTLNDFCLQNQTDLLVIFKPFRGILKTLFHESAGRSLVLQSTVPMLIV